MFIKDICTYGYVIVRTPNWFEKVFSINKRVQVTENICEIQKLILKLFITDALWRS